MQLFRRKPVEVNAIRFEYTPGGIERVREFCGCHVGNYWKARKPGAKGSIEVATLENDVGYLKMTRVAVEGDWIIKRANGGFFVRSPAEFERDYEAIL